MSALAAEQREMIVLQAAGSKSQGGIGKMGKVPTVADMLMFTMHPEAPGAERQLL